MHTLYRWVTIKMEPFQIGPKWHLKNIYARTHTHTHAHTHTHTHTHTLSLSLSLSLSLFLKGGIAPNQVIARSELEVHRHIYTE